MTEEQLWNDNTKDLQQLLDSLLDAPELNNVSAAEVYVNSCEECAQKQKDELDVLAAVYGDDFTILPAEPGKDTMLDITIRNLFAGDQSHSFMFSINIPATYPNVPPFFDIHKLVGFKRDQIDKLWQSIITIGEEKLGQPMLYDMISYCQEYMANLQSSNTKPMLEKQTIDTVSREEAVDDRVEEDEEEQEEHRVFTGMEFRNMFRTSDLFAAIRAVDQTQYRIVRVENIQNVYRQQIFADKCKQKNNRNAMKPIWVWHGTGLSNIPSIITRGLLPSGSAGVRMVNGNAYGNGVYLAKDPSLSLSYSREQTAVGVKRLLLCSFLPLPASSTEHGWGYVCRDGALILPSYAVDVMCDNSNTVSPVDTQTPLHKLMEADFSDLRGAEKLTKMKEYASRHLPFGFGSASGDAFQVLEVAPHDDDDDDTSYSESVYHEENYFSTQSTEYKKEIYMTTSDWEKTHYMRNTKQTSNNSKKK